MHEPTRSHGVPSPYAHPIFGRTVPRQVFDIRAAPRILAHVPFHAGPACLRFLPRFSSTLLVASASGLFSLLDVGGAGSVLASYMLSTEGTEARVLHGECVAAGCSSAAAARPCVCVFRLIARILFMYLLIDLLID